ncbi:MAG: Eco57I restriction-modification methylase domain-containing protein [Nitrosospira sp.]|nr:Eco57I restriction-modification methylase domain-containing protein [Nitrosospira sp.]
MSQVIYQLQAFKFVDLFNQLGWERLRIGLEKEVSGQIFFLQPVAHKRGVQILHCLPDSDGAIPSYAVRQKIERKVTADAREHLIIFTDAAQTGQVWQWVSRAPGRAAQYREVKWQMGQSTELLRQKLGAISFALNEEESLTVFGVVERLRGGFDRDVVTKKFYKAFQAQRDAFQAFIDGIPSDDHQRWYTAVVIDRLMFVWFLQEKGFLNNKKSYLRNRLEAHLGITRGVSFYKDFLGPLFFRGFAEERTETNRMDIEREFGKVPYLNGGLFAEHELEHKYGKAIDIPDAAFSSLFAFFDEWDWHLDERPLASGKEINPDVLGYIFEKFVNQKQMGAYYTKEDITEYITKNTVIPCLFEMVRARCAVAFDAHAWPLLRKDPRRYMYPAMLHGLEESYPVDIAAGLDTQAPNLLQRRKPWNKTAAPSHGLPTEIWRETITRHNRAREILVKLQAGEIHAVADLITCNLNIRQFAQDVIEHCADPALLRAFWLALAGRLPRRSNEKFRHGMSVLDPTCGSGAFLLAALQILKPLYQACLTAMSGLLADEAIAGRALGEKWKDIEEIVERFHAAALDRERDYAITKHIIVHNLYGVDIEAQATEIAKLRLFLKLVALLEPGDSIEPLPDIDFNIRAGNTLVGYANADETERAVNGAAQRNLFSDAWEELRIRLTAVERAYNNFQLQQISAGGRVTPEDKQALGEQLRELEGTLNHHLCREYGKNPNNGKEYEAWKASHKPLHWYVDFYSIMAAGGFDVVIGNPPYKDLKSGGGEHTRGYGTIVTKNLYSLCFERSLEIGRLRSRIGLIVPVSSISTEGYKSLQAFIFKRNGHVSSFDDRPSRLFDGLEHIQLTIHLLENQIAPTPTLWVTDCRRWSAAERNHLFAILAYAQPPAQSLSHTLPKIRSQIEIDIWQKISQMRFPIAACQAASGTCLVNYSRKVHNFLQVLDFVPEVYGADGILRAPTEFKPLRFATPEQASLVLCVLNSSLFRWYIQVFTDCRHVNKREVDNFPLVKDLALHLDDCWIFLAKTLSESLRANSEFRSMKFAHDHLRVQCIIPKRSKSVIDEIEAALGRHFGLTQGQLDYIINYDIKYRMGQGADTND